MLLEDDVDLAQTLQELLEDAHYSVDVVHNGNDAVDAAYERRYRLYVFDINVPDMNGLELLRALREADDTTAAIFISALVDLQTLADAFKAGADDYIKKPFFPEELLIRIEAKLQKQDSRIVFENFAFDPKTKVLYKNAEAISLGEVQQCLTEAFFTRLGQVVDKSVLLDCLVHPSDSALRVALTKLKKQTGLAVKNIRGVGYTLEKG